MNNLTKISIIASSSAVLFWSLFFLELPSNYYIAFAGSLIAFLLCFILLQDEAVKGIIDVESLSFFKTNLLQSRVLLCVFGFVSIGTILIFPSLNSVLFLEWEKIPIGNYARFLGALLSTNFLPGYAFLSLIDGKKELHGLEELVFSYILSILISLFSIIICSLTGLFEYLFLLVILLNGFLLLVVLFTTLMSKEFSVKKARIEILDILVMISLVIFACSVTFAVYTKGNYMKIDADMWRFVGSANDVIRFKNLLSGGWWTEITRTLSYPWGTYGFLATFFTLSGLPLSNAAILLIPTNTVAIPTFYLMVKSFFSSSKYKHVPIISTVCFFLFSGFGWVQVLYEGGKDFQTLAMVGKQSALDIYYPIFSEQFYWFRPLNISIVSLFALVYLLRSREKISRLICALIIVSIFVGYVTHIIETTLLIFILCPLFLLFHPKSRTKTYLSILLGLLTVGIIDSIQPIKFYTIGIYGSILLIDVAFISVVACLSCFNVNLKITFFKKLKNLRIVLGILLLYSFFLAIVLWLNNKFFPFYSRFSIVPWYFYPVKFGVTGLIAFLFFFFYLLKNQNISRKITFFALFTLLLILYGKIIFVPPWEQTRYIALSFIGISVLAAMGFSDFIKYIKNKATVMKGYIVSLLVATLIISGNSSTLLGVNYHMHQAQEYNLTLEEMAPLNFLSAHLTSASFFTIPSGLGSSRGKYDVIGEHVVSLPRTFFSESNPYAVFNILNFFHVKYIYLETEDFKELSEKYYDSFVLHHLIKYLPISFNNSKAIVFELPLFLPPQPESNVGVVIDSIKDYLAIDMIALSQIDYTTYSSDDVNLFSSQVLILLSDPSSTEYSSYYKWVQGGGHLIVFNCEGYGGFFSSKLDVKSQSVSVDGINGECEVSLPEMNIPVVNLREGGSVLSVYNYTNAGKPVSLYAYIIKQGYGKITYVNIYPYLRSIKEVAYLNQRRLIFELLGSMVGAAVSLSRMANPATRYAFLSDRIVLIGNTSLSTSYFFVKELIADRVVFSQKNGLDLCLANVTLQDFTINGFSNHLFYNSLSKIALNSDSQLTLFNFDSINVLQPLIISSCDTISNWKLIIKSDKLSIDNHEFKEGAGSIKWVINSSDEWDHYIVYASLKPLDLSYMESIQIWVHGNNTGSNIKFYIRDSQDNQYGYFFKDKFTGWKQIDIDIKKPDYQSKQPLNLEAVKYLIIRYELPVGKTATVRIDKIIIVGDLSPAHSSRQFNWIVNAHNTITAQAKIAYSNGTISHMRISPTSINILPLYKFNISTKSPQVSVSGVVSFDWVFIPPPLEPQVYESPLTITGTVDLTIIYPGKSIHVMNLVINGTTSTAEETLSDVKHLNLLRLIVDKLKAEYDAEIIPWIEMFFLYDHLIVLILTASTLLIYYLLIKRPYK